MARLRVGITGYGIVGKRRHECLDKHPRFETIAVCDRNFAADTTLANGVRAFTNYRSLLTVPLDVLVVCMSNDMAAEVTIAGLEHGLHVFCEKPPSRTLEELTA
ncbi:MAG: Gfo/Idh/MocA family protein, partial [Actinomycetota bacterium]